MISFLENKFHQAALKAYPDVPFPIEVTESTNEKFGHYQFNSAMKMAKALGKSPRDIASEVQKNLDLEGIEKSEIAGPGFINIFLTSPFLEKENPKSAHKQKIIVEFSSPNIAKELHVGHLRSTIIGDSLARLFEHLGHDVLRLNHIGDWGTQFGMLIKYLKENHPDVLSGKEKTDLPSLMQWYKEAKIAFDNDPDFKKESQKEVVALQSGEKDALNAWKMICDISRKGYQEIYDLLGVKLEERGESFYNPELPGIVKKLEDLNLITLSDGAKCLYLDGFKNREGDPLPLMLQKSDGGYNYDTTDMAAIHHRIFEEKADRIIYVTDLGQSLHFQMIFKGAEKAGWWDPKKIAIDHVGFGLVLGSDGKKFKTRSGATEKLIDLLYAGIDEAEKIISERSPDMPSDERKKLAKAIGLSAIKYADLSSHRTSDYTFSYEKMLKFEGNTAVFLMYSYVRILGIKRKIGPKADDLIKESRISLEHPSEIALGLHLARFPDVLDQMARDLLPNRLTDYLYQLAEKYNAFFRDCRVEGTPEMGSRLLLSEKTLSTMKIGFHILGIEPIEKM